MLLGPLFVLLALPPVEASAEHSHAGGHDGCTIDRGPNDLVSTDGPLVVPEGARAEQVVAVRGDVTVKRGAVVEKVVALAGSVRIESGATVKEEVVALGGDVVVARGARVGGDVAALGGRLKVAEGAEVGGDRLSLDLAFGGFDLRRTMLEELKLERCVVEERR